MMRKKKTTIWIWKILFSALFTPSFYHQGKRTTFKERFSKYDDVISTLAL